jgi:hypothetical protein
MNKFEKIVIIIALSVGLLGGVILIAVSFPPIVPSIFISTAISVLVYHFLGGIKDAGFKMGPIKMGGSIAALIGCAFVINHYLEPQMSEKTIIGKLSINKNYEVLNSQDNKLGDLPLNKYSLQLNKEQNIILCDSIELGKLKDSEFTKFNLYNQLNFENYSEINFNLQLSPVFKAELDTSIKGLDSRTYRNAYHSLPFEIKPEFYNRSDKTMVTNKSNQKTMGYYTLERHQITIITDFLESNSKIYLIRIRQLDRQSEENFVQYQIIGISCKKT